MSVIPFAFLKQSGNKFISPVFEGGNQNGLIYSICLQSDGKILVGGNFNSVNGVFKNIIVRLNQNGTIDNSFNLGGEGFSTGMRNGTFPVVTSIVIQNEKILVGGSFIAYNGILIDSLIRLNLDGSIDNSFNSLIGTNPATPNYVPYITKIITQLDGKIILYGTNGAGLPFYSYGGYVFVGFEKSKFLYLNENGTLIDSIVFINETSTNPNNLITLRNINSNSLTDVITNTWDLSDNTGEGIYYSRLRQYSPSGVKTSFTTSDFLKRASYTLGVTGFQTDNKIIYCDNYTKHGINTRNGIIRLNSNGSEDTSFITGSGFSGDAFGDKLFGGIIILSDAKILINGYFGTYNGSTTNGLVRLLVNGSRDTTFNYTNATFLPNIVKATQDNKYLISGSISGYNTIRRLKTDGSLDN